MQITINFITFTTMSESKNRLKPLAVDLKFNVIGVIIFSGAIIGLLLTWKDFKEYFLPDDSLLNWRFFTLAIILSLAMPWFVMNHLWQLEYDEHQTTKIDRDNFMKELKISENERLTDVITGIPNSRSLERDIDAYHKSTAGRQKVQFILIDLKNFRQINSDFGYTKTNHLLRHLSQSIYKRMRRNEDMYKYSNGEPRLPVRQENIYRVYPGGDEFAFIIEGDQADALGFCNRLVDQFKSISTKTDLILGKKINLSFHCALVEVDHRDHFQDIFRKAEECYLAAKEGTSDFTICWHPINIESKLSGDAYKQSNYTKAYDLFEVFTSRDLDFD